MTRYLAMLLVLAVIPSPTPASPTVADDYNLRQCRSAPVQALRFIEVGKASLWREDCVSGDAALMPPLALEFAYQRAVPGDAFSRSAMAMVERNVSPDHFADLRERLQAFNAAYRDIDDGDRYRLHYLDDGRLELRLNGELLAAEQGHEFARAYLSIWFGPQPYSDRLKRQLLAARP